MYTNSLILFYFYSFILTIDTHIIMMNSSTQGRFLFEFWENLQTILYISRPSLTSVVIEFYDIFEHQWVLT